jgi:predicted phosphoadenosine phosphosulfate sulfurtransferase
VTKVKEKEPSKLKKYIDVDVLTEAKKRIVHMINTFDTIVVMFSGGKDSLVTLNLVQEVYDELGITEKLKVVFRDEELIPDDVINFVMEKRNSGKYEFYYVAVPLKSHKFVLGETLDYIQWDPEREWLRPKPEFAIVNDGTILSQYEADEYIVQACGFKGKIAFVTGIRADESLVRFRSCVNKKNENYINATKIKNVKLVKPIYDWSESDVFKYFHDREIEYCMIYDKQMLNGEGLRVSTPLHAESAKRFGKIRTIYPQYYQQLVNIFPEMLVQERYWDDYDRYGIIEKYEPSWNGIINYINDHIKDPVQRKLNVQRVIECKRMRERKMKEGNSKTLGGYPILYVFKAIMSGNVKRVIQPVSSVSQKEREYEGL